jgi:hypothetical protein
MTIELCGDIAGLHEEQQHVNPIAHLTIERVAGPAKYIRTRGETSRGGDALANGQPRLVLSE